MATYEVRTKYFPCEKCGSQSSIFRICPCYYDIKELIPIDYLTSFPDLHLEFEHKMEWLLLDEQDEHAFMLGVYHFFNHYFGYHYYLPENMTAEIAVQQFKYLERICQFLQLYRETIFEGRQDRVRVHSLVDPIEQVNRMMAQLSVFIHS